MKRQTPAEPVYIDPVCLKIVAKKKTAGSTNYQLRTYYFCSLSCRSAFEKDPDRYLEQKNHGVKGGWNRYFERLRQVAG